MHTEDKEAATAVLEMALALYRVTKNTKYLDAAKIAADHVLTYTWAYRIDTFREDSSAAKKNISTFGAVTVSPENEHLDPFITTGLIELGLILDEPIYTQIGIQSLWWALDGRWAIPVPGAGAKQPEQFINTRWFYDNDVNQRGEFRDIPEIGWTATQPSYQFLKVGGALVYADLLRGVGIDGCEIMSLKRLDSEIEIMLQDTLKQEHQVLLIVKNLESKSCQIDQQPIDTIMLETGYPILLKPGEIRKISLKIE
jgi:hypothetical protein